MSGGGQSSGDDPQTVSQTTTNTPWSGQEPGLKEGFGEVSRLSKIPLEQYPNSTVIPYSPETEASLSGTTARAMQGNPLVSLGQQQFGSTLGGDYLNPGNPYNERLIESAVAPMRREFTETTRPGIAMGFSQSSRSGSNAMRNELDRSTDTYLRNVGDVSARVSQPSYEAERGRQMQAATLAPSAAEADYSDLGKLAGVGAARESQAGQYTGEDIGRYTYAQEEPWQRVARQLGLIGGANYGGSSSMTGTTPSAMTGSNPLLGMAGAGLGLAALQPWTWLGGGGAGAAGGVNSLLDFAGMAGF